MSVDAGVRIGVEPVVAYEVFVWRQRWSCEAVVGDCVGDLGAVAEVGRESYSVGLSAGGVSSVELCFVTLHGKLLASFERSEEVE